MNAQTPPGTLNPQEQSLIIISALTATGDLQYLAARLHTALDEGLTINEIKEALTQLYAYCGFPRSLNALNIFRTVTDERAAKGIRDNTGKAIIIENNCPDKYEQGRKVLEVLTKVPQAKPAPGFGAFTPRIDAFLKEHLFADIFVCDVLSYRQRELVTIAALAALTGTEPQLQSHIGMGMNTGITGTQLTELFGLVETYISKQQADIATNILFSIQNK
jgi:alkylhydroperoxidase/carboxymuconolactone decarboxylase family protein YurZ